MRLFYTQCMKVRLFAMLTGCTVIGGCSVIGVNGSGTLKSEVRQVGAFSAIDIAGPVDADVAIAAEARVEISGDDNLVPLATTEVQGDRLMIGTRDQVRTKLPLVARITAPRVTALGASGSGTIALHGIQDDNLTLALPGSGTISGDGAVQQLTIEMSGSGQLNLDQLAAKRVSVTLSGSGSVRLSASEALDVTISGSGTVSYLGNPQVKQTISGSGTVTKR